MKKGEKAKLNNSWYSLCVNYRRPNDDIPIHVEAYYARYETRLEPFFQTRRRLDVTWNSKYLRVSKM